MVLLTIFFNFLFPPLCSIVYPLLYLSLLAEMVVSERNCPQTWPKHLFFFFVIKKNERRSAVGLSPYYQFCKSHAEHSIYEKPLQIKLWYLPIENNVKKCLKIYVHYRNRKLTLWISKAIFHEKNMEVIYILVLSE